jgi:hypothetical protein
MRAALLAIGLAALLAACGGGGSSEVDGTPEEWAQRALDAMADAQSYRVEFSAPDADVEFGWAFEYAVPDSYHFSIEVGEKSVDGECYALPGGETTGDCNANGEITNRYFFEQILIGDVSYSRRCERENEGCDAWEEQERPPYPVIGPSPSYLPGWPLVAIELAAWDGVRGDGGDIVVRGTVNHLRAIFENDRRVLTAAGVTSFGQSCTAANETPVAIGENLTGDMPEGVECHEQTFEEMLAAQEPGLSFYDASPATIELTVSRDDGTVRRIELSAEAAPDHDEGVTLVIIYSRFGDVTIEAPP